jgi:hypothetical protein
VELNVGFNLHALTKNLESRAAVERKNIKSMQYNKNNVDWEFLLTSCDGSQFARAFRGGAGLATQRTKMDCAWHQNGTDGLRTAI